MENNRIAPEKSLIAIGEKLKTAREKKNLSIDQIQKQTHIHSTILIALEEGRCDEILPSAYVRSFLKKYSHYLGLDPKEILGAYLKLHPEEPREAKINIDNIDTKKSDIFAKFIYVVSITLLLVAVIILTAFLWKKAAISFKRSRTAKAVYMKKVSPAVAIPKVSAKKKAAEKAEPAPQISIPKKEPLNLILKVKQNVMVGVKKDGIVLFKRVMTKGASESFKADDRIEIYVAKAEAIELVLNGKSLGSPGRGVIKNLEITRKGIRAK